MSATFSELLFCLYHSQVLLIIEMGGRRICWQEACIGYLSSSFPHGEHRSKENFNLSETKANEMNECKVGLAYPFSLWPYSLPTQRSSSLCIWFVDFFYFLKIFVWPRCTIFQTLLEKLLRNIFYSTGIFKGLLSWKRGKPENTG